MSDIFILTLPSADNHAGPDEQTAYQSYRSAAVAALEWLGDHIDDAVLALDDDALDTRIDDLLQGDSLFRIEAVPPGVEAPT